MSPRDRAVILEKLASSVEKALEQSLTDKVTRTGAVLSPYYAKRLRDLIMELNDGKRQEKAIPGNTGV